MAEPSHPIITHLYHAAPLHYLPHIFQTEALYAADILKASQIAPRATAMRRDRMLGLSGYVHFSPTIPFPLLDDKIKKGYPHAIFVFHGPPVMELPGTALLPFNTKAWHTKAAYAPVTDRTEQEHLLKKHIELGRNPSLEVLAKYGVALSLLHSVIFYSRPERTMITTLLDDLGMGHPCPLTVTPSQFAQPRKTPRYQELRTYLNACREAKAVLPPRR